ncbi:MAG: helix-turn-helix transcriptional regulator [Microthrixaceae bacterium]
MLEERNTGTAVHRLRVLSGLNQGDAARRIGVPRSTLRSWESHHTTPDSDQLLRAVAVLGPDIDNVMVARRELIDPEHIGILTVGTEQILVADHLGKNTTPQEFNISLIHSYLAAVRRQRGLSVDAQVHLRSQDLSALAVVLDLTDGELHDLLITQFGLSDDSARRVVRGLLTAGLVALAASGTLQSSWLAQPGVATRQAAVERSRFRAGNLGPTVRGPVFWMGRGLPSELDVWKAATAGGHTLREDVIDLDEQDANEVESADFQVEVGTKQGRIAANELTPSNHR